MYADQIAELNQEIEALTEKLASTRELVREGEKFELELMDMLLEKLEQRRHPKDVNLFIKLKAQCVGRGGMELEQLCAAVGGYLAIGRGRARPVIDDLVAAGEIEIVSVRPVRPGRPKFMVRNIVDA